MFGHVTWSLIFALVSSLCLNYSRQVMGVCVLVMGCAGLYGTAIPFIRFAVLFLFNLLFSSTVTLYPHCHVSLLYGISGMRGYSYLCSKLRSYTRFGLQ
jgi:hypothetical protein